MTDHEPTADEIAADVVTALQQAQEIQDVLAHVLMRTRIAATAAAATALQGPAGADQAAAMLQGLVSDLDKLSDYANGIDTYSDGSPTVQGVETSAGSRAVQFPLWPAKRERDAR